MVFPINSYFNPSNEYKQTWSLVPQIRTLTVSNHTTKSLYSDLSASIPLFYTLMILAILFDIYLGFSVLAKSGVNVVVILGSVIFDLVFAIAPFLLENSDKYKHLNHIKIENQIFQKHLECMTMKINETDDEFQARKSSILNNDLKQLNKHRQISNFWRIIFIILIILIAVWKIYTYYGVLPPGINIFRVINGKIVIIFSILCATFHIIGSENAFAHFMFWRCKNEFKNHLKVHNGYIPPFTERQINYKGKYTEQKSGNTSVSIKDKIPTLQFINIILDDEIADLIRAQTDENAKRGIAIICKENQII